MTTTRNEDVLAAVLPPRRQAIVDYAMELFAAKGFQNTRVREIADGVGVLSGSLYSHFSSKVDMLDLGLRQYTATSLARNRALAASDADPREKIRLILQHSFDGIAQWPAAAAVLHYDWEYISTAGPFDYAVEQCVEFDGLLRDALQEAVESGVLAADVDAEIVVQFVRAILGGVVRRSIPDERFSHDAVADHLYRMIFGGLDATAVD